MAAYFPGKAQVVCDRSYLQEYTSAGNIEPYATKNLPNTEVLVAGKATLAGGSIYKAMAVKLSSSGSVI